jgi:hypothetical protein
MLSSSSSSVNSMALAETPLATSVTSGDATVTYRPEIGSKIGNSTDGKR